VLQPFAVPKKTAQSVGRVASGELKATGTDGINLDLSRKDNDLDSGFERF
jgi:hypothetical protein